MKAIGKNVLIEQKFVKKEGSNLILPENVKETDVSTYEQTLTLLGMGADCPTEELNIGDEVFINNYAQPLKVDKIEGNQNSKVVINHVIYEYSVIVGKK